MTPPIEIRRGFGELDLASLKPSQFVTASGLRDGGYIVWEKAPISAETAAPTGGQDAIQPNIRVGSDSRSSVCSNDSWSKQVTGADAHASNLRAEVERLTGERDRFRGALVGMLELETHTHRLPDSINREWLNGIVDDAKAAIRGEEDL